MPLKSITSLYLHWCTADTVKQFIGLKLPEKAHGNLQGQVATLLLSVIESHSTFIRLQIWYALLYVVVEGYQELGGGDEQLDKLLSDNDMVDAMRRFRNAVFHPQEDPLSEKLTGFLTKQGSEDWPHAVNRAFQQYFDAKLDIRGRVDHILASEINQPD